MGEDTRCCEKAGQRKGANCYACRELKAGQRKEANWNLQCMERASVHDIVPDITSGGVGKPDVGAHSRYVQRRQGLPRWLRVSSGAGAVQENTTS